MERDEFGNPILDMEDVARWIQEELIKRGRFATESDIMVVLDLEDDYLEKHGYFAAFRED